MSDRSIVHIELSADDREKAAEFYSKLFGWEVQQIPEMNYATFRAGEGPGGGFNPVSEDNPAGTVTIYVNSEDIEADLSKIESLGGKTLVPKTEIPTVGWFAMFMDPTGNKLALLTALEE
ncbi:MAG: VOC family protein [Anaerolineales bacterium]|jgi:predicted enzyme related to lactoylglutathione lyase